MGKIAAAYASNNVPVLKQAQTDLLRECDYNPSLLLPYFYPDFLDGEPMTLWSRPHAFAMMALIPNGSLTIAASRQIGKCVSGETKVFIEENKGGVYPITMKELFEEMREKNKLQQTGEEVK